MRYFKTEIIINRSFLKELIALLEGLGIEGYTILEINQGSGPRHGKQVAEGLLPVTHSTLLFTITSDEKAARIAEETRSFLKQRDGMLVSYPLHYTTGVERKS